MKEDENILLVLGASSEIGIGYIKSVMNRYDYIIAHYNSSREKLEKLKEVVGDRLILLSADFSDEASTRIFIDNLKETGLVPNHILHLPALKGSIKRFSKMPWNDFEERINLSLRSIVSVLSFLLPLLVKRGGGKIIIMLTIHTAQKPLKGCADYVTEKFALLGLIKALASEYEDKNIIFSGISPGAINTKFNSDLPEFVLEQYAANSKSGDNLNVSDLLPDIEYLFSDKCDNITGKNYVIDGSGLEKL